MSKKKIKEFLEDVRSGNGKLHMDFENALVPAFIYIVPAVIFRQTNIYLICSNEGDVELFNEEASNESLQGTIDTIGLMPVVVIPLKKYMYDLLSDVKIQDKVERLQLLNKVELEVIQQMRIGELKELRIILNPKKKQTDLVYKYSKSVEQKEINRIIDLFKDKNHVELTMKSADGRTVHYEYQRTKRFKE